MNKISKYVLRVILVVIVVAGCVYGGRVEYNDDVLSGMSYEKYQYIHDHIGGGSRSEVVSEYMAHKAFYDSITY